MEELRFINYCIFVLVSTTYTSVRKEAFLVMDTQSPNRLLTVPFRQCKDDGAAWLSVVRGSRAGCSGLILKDAVQST